MGPITIFDKSFLQSLNIDESVWFDKFFMTNITPLFYVETLADLEKASRAGLTPEQEVGVIADKTPQMGSNPNCHHAQLCVQNLMGNPVTMDGRILLSGGRPVKTADQSGIIFDIAPEAEALERWCNREFLIIERRIAKSWRKSLGAFDIEGALNRFNDLGVNANTCKKLEDAKSIADFIVAAKGYSFGRFQFLFDLLGLPERFFTPVFKRWGYAGCPSLQTFAPYSAHIASIELFFYIAAASNLISRVDASSKIDLAYLFYLPFCMIFVSSDKIHRRCSSLFMRNDQEFIWGPDLKADLKKIDQYYDNLPDSEKEKGLHSFATYPPKEGDFLVTRLWDRFLPKWRAQSKTKPVHRDKLVNGRIAQHVRKFANAETLKSHQADFDFKNPDAMVVKRYVHMKRGKWWILPKDLPNK
ncbi:MAG TPA: hypothetical protein ENI07_15715 [Desulfobacterales bacterium]|nr:hypothetical protein [Desulfobacterales bacterium]